MQDIENKFKELYCNNFNRIKNFANTYLKDEETAASIAQEVFISVLERKNSLILDETLLPYIFVLTKNRCINILKKESAKRRYQKDQLYQFNLDIRIDALNSQHFHNYDFERLKNIYETTLNELPESTRETFLLSRDNELKYKEIAEIQKISIKTVEYRMMFALRIFRRRLKDYYFSLFLFFMV